MTGEAQGDESSIKEFVQYLHQGSPGAQVSDVEHKVIDGKQGETGFGVQR